MKRFIVTAIIAVIVTSVFAQERQMGNLTITPYVPSEVGDSQCQKLLQAKLLQVTTANNVAQGFDRRFIIVPRINVISEGETSTIPQKTSLRVEFTFYIGDGVSTAIFKSAQIEQTGIGDSHNKALYSAIRKIRANDSVLLQLIEDAKGRIIKYYNKEIPAIIAQANNYIAQQDFENAIMELAVIPSACDRYIEIQNLIQQCGAAILQRNNRQALIQAQAAWSANPTSAGAKEAKGYLASIVITSKEEETAVNTLLDDIRERMEVVKDMEMEFERMKMESEERIRAEEIQTSAQTASSFFNMLPQLAYSIIGWLL